MPSSIQGMQNVRSGQSPGRSMASASDNTITALLSRLKPQSTPCNTAVATCPFGWDELGTGLMKVDPISHTVAHVEHAVRSLALLIPYTCDRSLPAYVQIALLEAWFNDYRLLIEFLLFKPVKKTARAQDFVEGWLPPSAARQVLARDYGVVSQSVSHIGEAVPSEPGEVDPPGLRSKAGLLFTVLEMFVDELDSEDRTHRCFAWRSMTAGRCSCRSCD